MACIQVQLFKLIKHLQQLSRYVERMHVEVPHDDISEISEVFQKLSLGGQVMDVEMETMEVDVEMEMMEVDVEMEMMEVDMMDEQHCVYSNVATRYRAWRTANGKMERMKNETAQGTKCNKGLWNCPRFKYSKETQELLHVMMQESRLTNFQQRHISNQIKSGALPLTCNPTSSKTPVQPELRVSKGTHPSFRPQKRSAEQCSAGDNYTRERFLPSATRDLEKEKHRLQNILATGQEEDEPSPIHMPANRTEDPEIDRFQEVLNEIEERRQFLEDMNALGRGNQYHHIINNEISQKIRELEVIDRMRSEALKAIEGQAEKAKEQP